MEGNRDMKSVKINIEGLHAEMCVRDWEEFHGITLCCAVLNEEANMKDFMEHHKPYVKSIVVVDGGSVDKTVSIASKYADTMKSIKFAGHYGNQKNRAIELADTDWVLFLDPDERLSKKCLQGLDEMINQDEHDCFSFPRINYVENEIDISRGGDHQDRLFRTYCRYIRATHEEIVGFKNRSRTDDISLAIEHRKPFERHSKRNNSYILFDAVHMNELGSPGAQTESSFKSRYKNLISTASSFLQVGK
jgi:glycosyltransferase involved in cell wall biosynthesis